MNRTTSRVFPFAVLCALTSCATHSGLPIPLQQDGSAPARSSVLSHGTTGRSIPNTVSQPTIFESPTIGTEIRPFFMHHEFPESSVFQGGDLQLYAVQLRYAVTDRLAIIATKDGFIDLNPGVKALEDEGFADIAAGVKYAFLDEEDDPFIVTGGLIFETDSGDHEVFQGRGDGVIRPFVSAGYEYERFNAVGSLGANLPIDTGEDSTSIDYHLHLDYEVTPEFAPLVELHGISFTRSGNSALAGFEGYDIVNLGASRVAGNDIFSGAIGARYLASANVSIGAAYEFPLGGRKDILDQRVTVDVIFTF